MTTFLTVKAAAQLVGKSASSVRRLIYPIIEAENHPDRQHIRPTVEEVPQLRLKGENFAWRVSEELLRREMPEPPPVAEPTSHVQGAGVGESSLVEMLRRELDIKNGQITQQGELIARQMDLISGLSERLREGNVLIATLQQRIAPPSKPVEEGIVEAAPPKPEPMSKLAQAPKTAPKPPTAPKKRTRRGLFGLFRSRA